MRQIRQTQRLARWRWRRVQRLIGEPPVELLAASVARRRRRLPTALRIATWAGKPNVEMVIVAPPGPDLGEPGPIRSGRAAQRPLDRSVDKDPRHRGLAC